MRIIRQWVRGDGNINMASEADETDIRTGA